jgi:hypothetical protein
MVNFTDKMSVNSKHKTEHIMNSATTFYKSFFSQLGQSYSYTKPAFVLVLLVLPRILSINPTTLE